MCLIASMMLMGNDPAAHASIMEGVSRDDFYQADHQIIFDAICEQRAAGKPVDAILTMERLKAKNLWEEIGGMEYIQQILNKVPSSAHGVYYAGIVREKSTLRQIIRIANETLRDAYGHSEEDTASDLARNAAASLADLANAGHVDEVKHISFSIAEVMRRKTEGSTRLHPTGLASLDELIGGMGYGMSHTIGALPGIGKSALLKEFICALAQGGVPCGLITLEERRQKVATNMLSRGSGVLNNRIQRGSATDEEWDTLAAVAAKLSELPIWTADHVFKLSEVVGMAHLLHAKYGCRAIFVDHVHLIDAEASKGMNRQQEVSKISKALKRTWSRLDVIGVQACQLNKSMGNARPTSANLLDSGSIHQDSDVVMLLHREDYHRRDEEGYTRDHILEVIVDKNKDGATGTVPLYYDEARYLILDQDNGRPVYPSNYSQQQVPINWENVEGLP
jgi:replicative DNA helicase